MKKFIVFLVLMLVSPFFVCADNLDEYKLKWTDEGYGTYAYNPLLEADRENFENFVFGSYYVNQSKFYSTLDGYIIVGHNTITKYSRTKGLEETLEYDSMRFIEVGDKFLISSYSYRTNNIKIELMSKELDRIATKYIKNSYLQYQMVEDDKLIVIYQDENYKKINSVIYNLNDLSIIKETSYYFGGYLHSNYFDDRWAFHELILGETYELVFDDSYGNLYILDKNLNLIPNNLNDNGTYTVFEKDKLSTYKTDGTLVDEVSLKDANYTLYNVDYWKYNSVYYTVSSEYTYDSTTKKYTNRARFVFYDENLNKLGTHIIDGQVSTSYGFSAYIYYYNNEIIVRYDSNYYKINDDLSFTKVSMNNVYSNYTFDNAFTVGDFEVSELVKIYYEGDNYLYSKAYQMKEEMCEGEADCYAYVNYIYDINYDADKEEVIINVTWHKSKRINSEYFYTQESELLVLNDKYDANHPLVIPIIKETELLKPYDVYPGAKLEVTDEYIIVGATVNGISKVLFYDKEFNLVKEFANKETGDKFVQKIDYDNGHIMIIYANYYPVVEESSAGKIENDDTMGVTIGYPDFPGVNNYGDEYYIEYYEKPYHIETKTDGNGTVTSEREIADSGEVIKFIVLPEEGYVLGEIKVTTKTGETIIFTDYEFTMPSADVIIEATFVPENPVTSSFNILLIMLLFISSIYFINKFIKKNDWIRS